MRGIIVVGVSLLIVTSFAFSSTVFAEDPGCSAEITKLCKDVKPGAGRIIDCLRKNDKALSDACKAYVNTASQYMACIDDAARLCPGMPPVGAMVIECLRANESDLSMGCEDELDKLRR